MMRTVALSAGEWAEATERAAGVDPVVLPLAKLPGAVRDDRHELTLCALMVADFLYFNLHGLPDQAYWYGDGWVTALTAVELAGCDLRGAIAFTTACFAIGANGTPGPMVRALLDAGCAAVVAGEGLNYSTRRSRPHGVDLLGEWVRRALALGWPVGEALLGAKGVVAGDLVGAGLLREAVQADRDALGFRVLGDGAAVAGRTAVAV